MKKVVFFIFIFSNLQLSAQEDAWVYFNSKPEAQMYFDNPLLMLSQRALDRRTLQNIPLDSKDIPIYHPFIQQIEASFGITIKAKSKWFNALHVQGSKTDIEALKKLSFVDYLDFANRKFNSQDNTTVRKQITKFNKTLESASNLNYGSSSNQINMLKGEILHQQMYSGFGKIIAVMDAGFPGVDKADAFFKLIENKQILGGYDYVKRNSNFYSGASHGTSVLSTMGGFIENQFLGTAPHASYYLFITEDYKSEVPLELSLWVEAAEEADRLGVDIITTSLGYTLFDNPNYNFTYEDMNGSTTFISKGLDIAFSKGIICVVSAGNEGNKPWRYITAPADANQALTVGAVDSEGNYANFSSQGPTFDGRIKPDVVAQGQQSVVLDELGNSTLADGTSFSGPILAGLVASLWQAMPSKTNSEIVDLIKKSSSLYTTPNTQLGFGIPDFNLALNTALSKPKFFSNEIIVNFYNQSSTISVSSLTELENCKISLYSTLGQKVLEAKVLHRNFTINSNDLLSGLYLYQITSDSFTQTGKIIKK